MGKGSIKWYAKQLAKIGLTDEVIGHLTKEAIEIHKQEIIEASMDGGFLLVHQSKRERAEKYYNETFKSE